MADITPVEPFEQGERLTAAKLNQIVEAVFTQITGSEGDITVQRFGQSIMLGGGGTPNVPISAKVLRTAVVLEEQDDLLLCAFFDFGTDPQLHDPNLGSNSMSLFYAAKPRLLQRTPFDGQTVTLNGIDVSYEYTGIGERTASGSGEDDEDQYVTPPYFAGDIIVVRKGPSGYTDEDDDAVVWTDINEGGRQWATKLDNS